MQHVSESAVANKEVVSHGANPRREEQQRREKEILMYRKKREINEGRDKKSLRDAVVIAASPFRGNVGNSRMDPTKEHIILLKDSSETPAGMCLMSLVVYMPHLYLNLKIGYFLKAFHYRFISVAYTRGA